MDELARLRESITRHAGDGVTRTALPGVSVLRSPTTTEPLGAVVGPTLGVVVQGVKETALNRRAFTYGPGQVLIVSVELPRVGHSKKAGADEPLLAFVLDLHPERIGALLRETAANARSGT